jgi:hypothetical protein
MADGIKYRNEKQKIFDFRRIDCGKAWRKADLAEMIATGKVEYGKNKMLTEKSRKQIKALIKQSLRWNQSCQGKKNQAPKAKKAATKGTSKADATIKDP